MDIEFELEEQGNVEGVKEEDDECRNEDFEAERAAEAVEGVAGETSAWYDDDVEVDDADYDVDDDDDELYDEEDDDDDEDYEAQEPSVEDDDLDPLDEDSTEEEDEILDNEGYDVNISAERQVDIRFAKAYHFQPRERLDHPLEYELALATHATTCTIGPEAIKRYAYLFLCFNFLEFRLE